MSKTTENYGLTKPEVGEFFSLETWNGNLDKIDEELKKREDEQKESDNSLMNPEFTEAKERKNLTSGEKIHLMLGKIAKFFTDLKTVAFTGSYNDLTNKPSVATQTADGMLSATDKKAIDLLGAPIGSCATGRTTAAKVATLKNFKLAVGLSIAVKFTNTAGTANPASGNLTLNVNGTGAKTIGYFRNGNKFALTYASGGLFCNNATHIFTYDGVYWLCMDWNADNNTTYDNFVKSGIGAKAGLVPAPSKTAGTTKYLREDGAWAVPPDTKTSIINNQTTTVAGFALDARQANPNIDGTLAKQISDLNGSLERQGEKTCTLVNATGAASYICDGLMAQVTMEIIPTDVKNGKVFLKGLPRPAQTLYLSLPAINGNNIPCVLNYNGELVVYFRDETNSSISRIDHSFCYMYDQWN